MYASFNHALKKKKHKHSYCHRANGANSNGNKETRITLS